MLPKLYDEITQGEDYTSRYIGTLTHCRKCEVHEVRNGAYTVNLETTVNDECADLLLSQRMIGVKPNPFDNMQLFEIQKTTRALDGIIKVEGKHIKNLCFQLCSEGDLGREGEPTYYRGNPRQVWNRIVSAYIPGGSVPFTFTSDITTRVDYYLGLSEAETLGNMLGGKEGSFTDMWSGEFHWDNYNIEFLKSRGRDTGFKIQYGQNISSATQSETCEGMYSHVLPYGKVSLGNYKINFFAPVFEIDGHQCKYRKTYMLDCTSFLDAYEVGQQGAHYEEVKAAMTKYAKNYAKVNSLGKLSVSIKVDMRAALDEMNQIGLCDTVQVSLDNFGTKATAQIVDVTYDALLERWTKLVIGTPTITVADLILNRRRYLG